MFEFKISYSFHEHVRFNLEFFSQTILEVLQIRARVC